MTDLDRRLFLKGVLGSAAYGLLSPAANAQQPPPPAESVLWNPSNAHHESTSTRERISINGLWRWQPESATTAAPPAGDWGHLRVPEAWPGNNREWPDPQSYFPNPAWDQPPASGPTAAWYEREITVPADWAGRRITLNASYVNSYAAVYLDRAKVGEIRFPAGEIDLTAFCHPGQVHLLSIFVVALPLKAVMMSFADSAAARQITGSVERRGLCGDIYLSSTPAGPHITDLRVETSVRNWEIAFDLELATLDPNHAYSLHALITDEGHPVKDFTSLPFHPDELAAGRIRVTENWHPEKLWDTHTPKNQYDLTISLIDSNGKILDVALPVRFGFREFWIAGKDFYLNGTRLYLAATPINNAQGSANQASYEATRANLQWLKSFGINFVYTHNYGCEPGTHRAFEELLRAADDEGVLVAFSQPHFGQYTWDTPDADTTNGYAQHAAFYVRVAQNHPAVVCYVTSHNGTGYGEDMNPDMLDGIQAPRDNWSVIGAGRAMRAEAIIRQLDPTRIVYHHAGNLGTMHSVNFYGNWIPPQEMSDWFEHWATYGVKPVFTCEYSVPFMWDWGMYRGWYKGKRAFGDGVVPWESCMAEWNAQTLGPRAYQISSAEKQNLRWEAEKFRHGLGWHRWDAPHPFGSPVFEDAFQVMAQQVTENFRAMRTWGNSATSPPWDIDSYWVRSSHANPNSLPLQVNWEQLQRPGPLAAYVNQNQARELLAYHPEEFKPTHVADALYRNYMPLLAYIAGKPAAFTSKDHNFHAGESIEKQLILINNSRIEVTAQCNWHFDTSRSAKLTLQVTLPPGDQKRIPIKHDLSPDLSPAAYQLNATVDFGNGNLQSDNFTFHVLPRPTSLQTTPQQRTAKFALFDPKGETAKLLDSIGVQCDRIDTTSDASQFDLLIIGKGALNLQNTAPNLSAVRDGLKVIIFEQTGEVLQKRFGFRIAEYGLRWVFKRVPDHPILTGLAEDHLRNWRGASTTLPPRLNYTISQEFSGSPSVEWAGIPVTRVWRRGNRGNVASALIEKPASGHFLPILDGGYALQYASLLQHRAGKGLVLFCQTDVTGRTENDPAAQTLARNILEYASNFKPAPSRNVVYAGDNLGKEYLTSAQLNVTDYRPDDDPSNHVLVVGPGAAKLLAPHRARIASSINAGCKVLALGLDDAEANSFLPMQVSTISSEHIAACFEPFPLDSPFAGISPAELHNRDPRNIPLIAAISGDATIAANGVLATAASNNVVLCQLVPWQFDYSGEKMNVKRAYRRVACLLARLLANMQADSSTSILNHISTPLSQNETRWLAGLYLDSPEEWDDPYRFFRW
jgi:hypothetical protein